jgi:hypothetical protein
LETGRRRAAVFPVWEKRGDYPVSNRKFTDAIAYRCNYARPVRHQNAAVSGGKAGDRDVVVMTIERGRTNLDANMACGWQSGIWDLFDRDIGKPAGGAEDESFHDSFSEKLKK